MPGGILGAIRKLLPYTSAVFGLSLLYVGWTFFSRWDDRRSAERAVEAAKAQADAEIVAMYADGRLKIFHFYVSPGMINRGQKGLLCYGVANAVKVRIEPGVEPLKPSLSRCIEIAPVADTQYTLTAEDGAGKTVNESILVRVLK